MAPTITIDDILHHLLMEEEQVCLPGLGTLRLTPQPALLSPIERKVLPPSELVSFNANLVLDDGQVLRAVAEAREVDTATAQRMVEDFLQNMRENLDAGRAFTIDQIGRFFKQADGQIRFTPTGDNFSKDSYGLPAVELQPIVRTEKQRRDSVDPMLADATAAGTTGSTTGTTEKTRRNRRRWFRRPETAPEAAGDGLLYNAELRSILWYVVVGMAALLLLAGVYKTGQYLVGRSVKADSPVVTNDRPRQQVPADRINVAPGPPQAVDADEVRPDDPPRLNQPKSRTFQQPAPDAGGSTTGSTPAPTTTSPVTAADNVALIATGMFGSQRNVEKNLDRIKAAGFETFARPEGRLTRIGAKLEYQTEAELTTALERLRRLYSDAFVMEVNGKKRTAQ